MFPLKLETTWSVTIQLESDLSQRQLFEIMAGNSKKPKVFADFSIATLLRKDDESRPGSGSNWGDLKQPSVLSTEIEANYFNYGLRLPYGSSYGCSLEATNSQEEDELISVCGDYNDDLEVNRERHEDSSADSTFAWLTCTRFKPPKLPRKFIPIN